MTAPVTCVITNYNNGATLFAAVSSVLNQTLPVAEIIIADDGSTDGSRDLIIELAREHAGITPILRDQNVGVAANRDLAIRAASQPFVTHLDGDDLFARRKVEGEWKVLDGSVDKVAYSLVARIRPKDLLRSVVLDPAESVSHTSEQILANLISRRGSIPRDMLLSKALFERAEGFSHNVPLYEDWQFKMRLATLGVTWVPSGVIGTMYMDRLGSLSKAEGEQHSKWKKQVVQDLLPLPVEIIAPVKVAAALRAQFESEVVQEMTGISSSGYGVPGQTFKIPKRAMQMIRFFASMECIKACIA